MNSTLTPVGHHLLNAYMAWFAENNIEKIHIVVDTSNNPSLFIRTLGGQLGRSTFNIGPLAVHSLIIDKTGVSFKAGFSGNEHHVFLFLSDILGVEILIGGQVVLIDLFDVERNLKNFKETPLVKSVTADPSKSSKLSIVK
jgi:stringent starvation protein B